MPRVTQARRNLATELFTVGQSMSNLGQALLDAKSDPGVDEANVEIDKMLSCIAMLREYRATKYRSSIFKKGQQA